MNNPLPADDGDIIKGLGFVVLYSAYLEEEIDEFFETIKKVAGNDLSRAELREERAGEKIKLCIRVITAKQRDEMTPLLAALQESGSLLNLRHEYIHARIYSDSIYSHENTKNTRIVPPTRKRERIERKITSAELYDLANRMCTMNSHIMGQRLHLEYELAK